VIDLSRRDTGRSHEESTLVKQSSSSSHIGIGLNVIDEEIHQENVIIDDAVDDWDLSAPPQDQVPGLSGIDVQFLAPLGSGGFGEVYRGTWTRASGTIQVAVKRVRNFLSH
jgi:hypothetical protein